MYKQLCLATALLLTAASAKSQDQPRKMTPVRGGSPDRGKCTIEIVVDGAAEVEVRGDVATLHNLSGALPRWRRFECTGPLPRNPDDFRFAGVDGRGNQQLVRGPGDGRGAIVRIEDSGGGSEGYTFDIFWADAPHPIEGRIDGEAFHRDRKDAFRRDDWRMHLFARVREDLEYVHKITFTFGSDRYRIAQATEQLDQLQRLLAHGRYDPRELDDVVNALRRVVSDNRLSSRDREILKDDLRRLQDFRAHFREYGVQ